jgi:hypothetical protein
MGTSLLFAIFFAASIWESPKPTDAECRAMRMQVEKMDGKCEKVPDGAVCSEDETKRMRQEGARQHIARRCGSRGAL